MSAGLIMVFKRCKCGELVGCLYGDKTRDGDLIDHANCKKKIISEDVQSPRRDAPENVGSIGKHEDDCQNCHGKELKNIFCPYCGNNKEVLA